MSSVGTVQRRSSKRRKRTVCDLHVVFSLACDQLDQDPDLVEHAAAAARFRDELHAALLAQVDAAQEALVVQSALTRATSERRRLRSDLLALRQQRQAVDAEMAATIAAYEQAKIARQRLDATHKFVTELESVQRVAAQQKATQSGERFTAASNARAVLTGVAAFGGALDTVRRHTQFLSAASLAL